MGFWVSNFVDFFFKAELYESGERYSEQLCIWIFISIRCYSLLFKLAIFGMKDKHYVPFSIASSELFETHFFCDKY